MKPDPVKVGQGGARPAHGLRLWIPPLLAAALLWAAFPPLSLSGAIFVAWLPILQMLQESLDAPPGLRPRGLWRRIGLTGVLFYAALLHWILHLSNEQVTIPGLMIPSLARKV